MTSCFPSPSPSLWWTLSSPPGRTGGRWTCRWPPRPPRRRTRPCRPSCTPPPSTSGSSEDIFFSVYCDFSLGILTSIDSFRLNVKQKRFSKNVLGKDKFIVKVRQLACCSFSQPCWLLLSWGRGKVGWEHSCSWRWWTLLSQSQGGCWDTWSRFPG